MIFLRRCFFRRNFFKPFDLKVLPEQAKFLKPYVGKEVIFGIRPEDVEFSKEAQEGVTINGHTTVVEPLGSETHVYVATKIGQVIGALSKILRDMPNLCVTIQSVIPDKLASLSDRYEELLKAGYPLHHLLGPSNIQEMRDELDEVTAQVQNFDLSGVQQHLDGIIARIDDYIAAFEREKEARVAFEGEVEGIYAEDSKVENRYIRLCNSLPEVRSIYAIPSSEQEKIDAIKAQINRSGATKRSLDTLMHSGSRQPYTILVERMHALRDESNQAFQAIEDFNRYLLSLKSDSEEAARSIYVYEDRLRTAEYRVRVIDLPCIKPVTVWKSMWFRLFFMMNGKSYTQDRK